MLAVEDLFGGIPNRGPSTPFAAVQTLVNQRQGGVCSLTEAHCCERRFLERVQVSCEDADKGLGLGSPPLSSQKAR